MFGTDSHGPQSAAQVEQFSPRNTSHCWLTVQVNGGSIFVGGVLHTPQSNGHVVHVSPVSQILSPHGVGVVGHTPQSDMQFMQSSPVFGQKRLVPSPQHKSPQSLGISELQVPQSSGQPSQVSPMEQDPSPQLLGVLELQVPQSSGQSPQVSSIEQKLSPHTSGTDGGTCVIGLFASDASVADGTFPVQEKSRSITPKTIGDGMKNSR